MPKVYFRQHWEDAWVEEPYVYLVDLARRVNERDEAVLEHEFGRLRRTDDPRLATYEPLERLRWFVKLEIETVDQDGEPDEAPTYWYGFVLAAARSDNGVRTVDSARVPTGRMRLTCVGLEYLLERERIHWSRALVFDSGVASPQWIPKAMTFNDRSLQTAQVQGNRSLSLAPEGQYLFAGTLAASAAEAWDGLDIVDYLLAWLVPWDEAADRPVIPWSLRRNGIESALRNFRAELPQEGETVKSLLDRLFDRRRMLGWLVELVEGGGPEGRDLLEVVPVSRVSEDIWVPPDFLVPANLWPAAVDVDFSPLITAGPEYSENADSQFDQVWVLGAWRTSTATFGWEDLVWEEDWTPDQRAAYDDAASGEAGYSTLDYASRARLNAIARSKPQVERVYRWFRVKASWDGRVRGGENGAAALPVFPQLDASGEPTDQASPVWLPGLRFAPHLALLGDHDYSDALGEEAPSDTPDGGMPERRPPLALIKLPDSGLYARLDALPADDAGQLYSTGEPGWAASVRPQDRALGVVIDVHGKPQHALAAAAFVSLGDEDYQPDLDYRENLMVTLSVVQDERAIAIYPPYVDAPLPSVLEIELGEDFRLDYLAPQTVVDLDEGGVPVRNVGGGWIRDDRERMHFLAQLAYQWYRVPRRALTMSYAGIGSSFRPGALITSLGGAETETQINTIVEEVRWQWPPGGVPTTSIATSAAEPDLATIAHQGGKAPRKWSGP